MNQFLRTSIKSILIISVDLRMGVRIVNNYRSTHWDVLILKILEVVDWVWVLIDHSSLAGTWHFHLLRVHLMVNDWFHFYLSLHGIFQFGQSLDLCIVLVDLVINHHLWIKYLFTGLFGFWTLFYLCRFLSFLCLMHFLTKQNDNAANITKKIIWPSPFPLKNFVWALQLGPSLYSCSSNSLLS